MAIITGGGRGIGKAAAEQLARRGAAVVVTARSQEQIEQAASGLRSHGSQAMAIATDVSDLEQVTALVDVTLQTFGRIDIVVNNAAVLGPVQEVAKTDPKEWAYNIQVNVLGPFYLTHAVLPHMIEQNYGRVVNVSSGAAVNPIVGASAYSSSKAALDMFVRATAQELLNSNVSITSFHPGMVDTEMQVDLRRIDTRDAAFDLSRFHNAYEQKQLRSADDVARGIVWLAGQWSGAYSGQIFRITDEAWLQQIGADLGQ